MNERKGLGRIDVTFHGKAAHAGVDRKRRKRRERDGPLDYRLHGLTDFGKGTTLNAGVVSGGTTPTWCPRRPP